MSNDRQQGHFENTWPMFDEGPRRRLPANPLDAVNGAAPPSSELSELSHLAELPESFDDSEIRAQRLRQSIPAPAPEWMRAAQSLVAELTAILARGGATLDEQRALSRTWAAWSLAGVSESQVLRTAYLVLRAHEAIHKSSRAQRELDAAILAVARVLQAGLPSAIRDRLPPERVEQVVQGLRRTEAPWPAVVEGTADLLGWKDDARSHAAAVIRSAMERRSRG